MQFKDNDSVIVSWNFTNKDSGVLLVGQQVDGRVIVVNAFEGQEAHDIYEKLTTMKGE